MPTMSHATHLLALALSPAVGHFDGLLKARRPDAGSLTRGSGYRGGITPGGPIRDHEGAQWYMKRHDDPEHAHSEHLANVIYRGTGHSAPHSIIAEDPHGAPVYLSKFQPGFHTLGAYQRNEVPGFHGQGHGGIPHRNNMFHNLEPRLARDFLAGTAVDALVHAGDLHYENIGLLSGRDGRQHISRIDNGAALLHNAGGNRKYGEHLSLYAPTIANQSHRNAVQHLEAHTGGPVMRPMDDHRILTPGLVAINRLHAAHGGSWRRLVDRHIPTATKGFRGEVADFLHERHNHLKDHVRILHENDGIRRHPATTPLLGYFPSGEHGPTRKRQTLEEATPATPRSERLNALRHRTAQVPTP